MSFFSPVFLPGAHRAGALPLVADDGDDDFEVRDYQLVYSTDISRTVSEYHYWVWIRNESGRAVTALTGRPTSQSPNRARFGHFVRRRKQCQFHDDARGGRHRRVGCGDASRVFDRQQLPAGHRHRELTV